MEGVEPPRWFYLLKAAIEKEEKKQNLEELKEEIQQQFCSHCKNFELKEEVINEPFD